MLLAADVGNTEIVLGVFRGATLEHTWRLSTQPERTPDELALTLSGFLEQRGMAFESQVTGLVVASVVPDVTATIREMTARYFPLRARDRGPRREDRRADPHRQPSRGRRRPRGERARRVHAHGRPGDRRRFRHGHELRRGERHGRVRRRRDRARLQASAASLFSRTARLTRVELAAAAARGRQEHGRGDPVGPDLRHGRRGRRHRRRASAPSCRAPRRSRPAGSRRS